MTQIKLPPINSGRFSIAEEGCGLTTLPMMAHLTLTGDGHGSGAIDAARSVEPLRTKDCAMTAQGALNSVSCFPLYWRLLGCA